MPRACPSRRGLARVGGGGSLESSFAALKPGSTPTYAPTSAPPRSGQAASLRKKRRPDVLPAEQKARREAGSCSLLLRAVLPDFKRETALALLGRS